VVTLVGKDFGRCVLAGGTQNCVSRPAVPSGGGRGAQKPRTRPAVLRRRPAQRSEHRGQAGPGAAREETGGKTGEKREKSGAETEARQEHNARARTPSTEATHGEEETNSKGGSSPRGGARVAAGGRERVWLGGPRSGGDRCGCGRVGCVSHGSCRWLVGALLVSDVVVGCKVSDDVVSVGSLEGEGKCL
jgi:hypothetical protein